METTADQSSHYSRETSEALPPSDHKDEEPQSSHRDHYPSTSEASYPAETGNTTYDESRSPKAASSAGYSAGGARLEH